ncbi:MAG: hypothetical protein CFE26_03910 [Verrucomicrobiales bacterium VVV1]|nr:MAG: hypothetical protein CFE26_03910 [Verrucomicrobiales bacterium VVV1]
MTPTRSQILLNGEPVDVSAVPVHETLLDFLRKRGLTGTKCGCNEGDCGACSLLLVEPDGELRSINSCLALVQSMAGREIRSVEGIASGETLHPVQSAMVSCNGSQCGYCTPGFIASMVEGCHRKPPLSEDEIADQLCGNLCRCTGYRPIREAMLQALDQREELAAWSGSHAPGEVEAAPVESLLEDGFFLRPETIEHALIFKCRLHRRGHRTRRAHQQAPRALPGADLAGSHRRASRDP